MQSMTTFHESHECLCFTKLFNVMANFDFLEGAILTDEEMVVVHGGISVAMTGGSHCGSGCDGGGGSHCGKDCRPAHLESSSTMEP